MSLRRRIGPVALPSTAPSPVDRHAGAWRAGGRACRCRLADRGPAGSISPLKGSPGRSRWGPAVRVRGLRALLDRRSAPLPGPSSLLFSISFPPSLLCLLPSSFPSSLLSFLPFFAPFLPPFLPPSFPFSLSSLLHSLPSSLLPSFLLCRLPSFSPSLLPSSPPSLRPSLPLRAFPSLPPPSPGPAGSHVGSAPSLCRRVPDSDCLMPTLLLPILFRGLPLAFPRSPASRVGPDRSESSALQLLKAQVGKPSQKSESELRVELRVGDPSRDPSRRLESRSESETGVGDSSV